MHAKENNTMSDASVIAPTDPVEEVRGAFGLTAWGADVGHGSLLTFELGAKRTVGGRPHGDFHLWIYLAAWRIEQPDRVLVSSEDDELATRVGILNGRTLQGIVFSKPSMSSTFRFDEKLILTTFSIYTNGGEHWMLYRPDGTVFTAGPGPHWSTEAATRELSNGAPPRS
jgi:hypothetical protein